MKRVFAVALLMTLACTPAYAQGGRLVMPFEQALDSVGVPISGALWCFQAAGTTTDTAVYSDKALSVSLGSTVTTNSIGRLSSDVYGGVPYKITLKTGSDCATGTTVAGPWDNIEPKVDFSASYLTSASATSFTANSTWTNTDADASADPIITLYRNSASPAGGDVMGQILFDGEDDGGNQLTYGLIQAEISDPADGSEDGKLSFRARVAGSIAERVSISGGLVVGNPTGGDQGAGLINAVNYFKAGAQLSNTECFTSTAQTMAANTTLTIAHGLSAAPWSIDMYIQNTTTDLSYEVGDQVFVVPNSDEQNGGADEGIIVQRDATNLIVYINDEIDLGDETSGAIGNITLASWDLYIRACL